LERHPALLLPPPSMPPPELAAGTAGGAAFHTCKNTALLDSDRFQVSWLGVAAVASVP
jgi:hypothetical protein